MKAHNQEKALHVTFVAGHLRENWILRYTPGYTRVINHTLSMYTEKLQFDTKLCIKRKLINTDTSEITGFTSLQNDRQGDREQWVQQGPHQRLHREGGGPQGQVPRHPPETRGEVHDAKVLDHAREGVQGRQGQDCLQCVQVRQQQR